jgi:HK97 family phage prohead protease
MNKKQAITQSATQGNQPANTDREIRTLPVRELRVTQDAGAPAKLVGYASVFNAWSEDLGGFRERVQPGAFSNAVKASDIRALINHDPSLILGRTKNGTLSVREDDTGLWMEVALPDTQYARDLAESVKRGDIDQMSFGFSVLSDDWVWADDGTIRRTIIEIDRLYDVSPVTYPAYPQTSVSARSRLTELQGQNSEHQRAAEQEQGQAASMQAEREAERQAAQELMRMRLRIAEVEL